MIATAGTISQRPQVYSLLEAVTMTISLMGQIGHLSFSFR